MIDIDQLRRLAQAALIAPGSLSPEWMDRLGQFQEAADPSAISELLDRLEAAEKEIALKERVIDALGSELNAVAKERDELRAKIESMEKQKPVGKAGAMPGASGFTMACFRADAIPFGSKLYALPGAQPTPPDGSHDPAEVAVKLRQFNEWRTKDYAPSEQPEPPNPYEVGLAIDAAVELLDETERLRTQNAVLMDAINAASALMASAPAWHQMHREAIEQLQRVQKELGSC